MSTVRTAISFASLTHGSLVSFNPALQYLDLTGFSASQVSVTGTNRTRIAAGGKVVTLNAPLASLTSAEFLFPNGSALRIGDEAFSQTGDLLGNALTGTAENDQLQGLDGDDTLDGGAGSDLMVGGSGDDTYFVDSATDLITELSGGGLDRVYSIVSYTLANHIEELSLSGNAALSGTGNALNNALWGNDGDNLLRGLDGTDNLVGGAGNDTLEGGTGNDTLEGGGGNDRLVGGTGDDVYNLMFFTGILADLGTDSIIETSTGGIDTVQVNYSYTLTFGGVEKVELFNHRTSGGIVIDVANNEIVLRGLSMPHSPRWYRGKLWLCDSGTGYFGYADFENGKFERVAFCPGYMRGLAFHGDFAIVGLSKPRHTKTFSGLPLDENLSAKQAEARCGLQVIDLRSGDVVHWLRLDGIVEELYDVVTLPGVRRPKALGFKTDEIRRVLSVEPGELA